MVWEMMKQGIKKMNRRARRNAKKKRKEMLKAMSKTQPVNDIEPAHNGVPFWNVYPITVAPRLFLGSSSAHRQFVGHNEENFN
jgi:hypothetical protein